MAALSIQTAVILCADDLTAAKDRELLAGLEPRTILHFRSGADILDFLRAAPVDLVLLDDRLRDMNALEFLKLARAALRAAKAPIFLLSRITTRDYVLDAVQAGCSAFLSRPCSQKRLEERLLALRKAQKPVRDKGEQIRCGLDLLDARNFDDAVAVFEAAVADQRMARDFFDEGCRLLVQKRYNGAIAAFQNAVAVNDLYAEAYEGLAQAYGGMGDHENMKRSLQKAAQTHAAYDSFENCRRSFAQILKEDPGAANPYNALGLRLRKQGDIPGAIHAYKQALKLSPDDENKIGRAHV